MAPQAAEALKNATAETGQICTETGKVVNLKGAPYVQPKSTKPPVQKSMIGEHSKDLLPIQYGIMPFAKTTTQMQQQVASGGLIETPTEQIVTQRARQMKMAGQPACSAIAPK